MAHELYTASAINHPPNPHLPGIGGVLFGEGPPGVDLGSDGNVYVNIQNGDIYTKYVTGWEIQSGGAAGLTGSGSPEGVVTAEPGTTYWDSTNQILWVKNNSSGNTGWYQLVG